MSSSRPARGEHQRRLAYGEALLEALRRSEIDALVGETGVSFIRDRDAEEKSRKDQEQLEASRSRYFDLYNLAPVGYLTLSESGLILEANLLVASLLDMSPDELVSEPVTRFIVPEDRQIYYEYREKLFKSGEPQLCELRLVKKSGSLFWALVEATVSKDNNGTFMCRVVMTDITPRKQVEAALEQVNHTLEQRVAEHIELAETRARQLQTLAVELIEVEERERKRIADFLHDDLQQILAAAKLHLQVITHDLPAIPGLMKVDELLKQSIDKSRRLSHELSPMVVRHSSLHVALNWLAGKMKEQFGLEVHLEADAAHEVENASIKVFLFRAVQELLFNVSKHSGVHHANVGFSVSDDLLEVTVSDRGKGFDLEIIDYSNGKGGLGILSLQERVQIMGGNLLIRSVPEKGSVFTLQIPLGFARAERRVKQVERRRQPTGFMPDENPLFNPMAGLNNIACACGLRVLFVDDHHVMRQGLINLITSQPEINIIGEAANGWEAIEKARLLKPDVVVMDISMPEMDGMEATRRIKAELPEIRVVCLSMYAESDYLVRTMLEAGAETFVSKNCTSAELLKAIYGFDC